MDVLDYLTRCYRAHLDGGPVPSLIPTASSHSAGLTGRRDAAQAVKPSIGP